MYRFVCQNGMVCGDTLNDIRIPHIGAARFRVSQRATRGYEGTSLNDGEQAAFAWAALTLKYDDPDKHSPITEDQLLTARRFDDRRSRYVDDI